MRWVSRSLIYIVVILLIIGIIMLASTSSVRGSARFGDPEYFLKRQTVWLVVSLVAMAVMSRCDYHWWRKRPIAIAMGVLSVAALCLVFVPGIGGKTLGSYRWIRLGPLSAQPSEFAKLTTIILLAAWMADVARHAGRFRSGLLAPMTGLGLILGLLMAEPDFGTTALLGAVGMAILFAGGTRFTYLSVTALLGAGAFVLAVLFNPERIERVFAFLFPDKYPDAAHQVVQSKVAFIGGGWFGRGLGNSMQKQAYLPEAHTDFIFAIIGEELGFVVTAFVVLLFVGFFICGMIVSYGAVDRFGKLMAFGLTMMIGLQAAINMGVVTGCLPTKGLALPFISYGGTCLLISLVSVGILLNIARHAEQDFKDRHTKVIRNRTHRF